MNAAKKISAMTMLALLALGAQAQPAKPPTDKQITDAVQHAINRAPELEGDAINVRTSHGKVYLSGSLDSKYERHVAKRIARKVPGVKSVVTDDISIVND